MKNKYKIDSGVVNIPEGEGLGFGEKIKNVIAEGEEINNHI